MGKTFARVKLWNIFDIDSKRGRLVPNPESPDAPLLDVLRIA